MKLRTIFTTLFFLIIIAFAISFFVIKNKYNKSLTQPNSDSEEQVTFVVEPGETPQQIIESLIENGLLRKDYKSFAKYYLRSQKIGTKLEAGTFFIKKNTTMTELFETLQHAVNKDVWVTIPEGLRKDEIAKIVQEEFTLYGQTEFSAEEFLALSEDVEFISTLELADGVEDLEGFLYPDRYAFAPESTAKTVIEKLVYTFKDKIGEPYTYKDVIVASLVERESRKAEEKPIIAGIIWKRYNEGWLLQIDASLLYAYKDWKHVITEQDIEEDTPYNVYKKEGLPPTPICNPGIETLKATLNPEESEYYYYIHDNNGQIHYAKTLQEHNSNVSKYLY
ncbi:endolytic transglycosylase MltG [bacterium]|nr:endolytic transglycosylase MltG [bacterium]